MIAIGIDLGVNGAVAVLAGDAVTVRPLPIADDRTLDADAFARLLSTALIGTDDLIVSLRRSPPPHLVVFEAVFRPNSLVRMQGEVASLLKLFGFDHFDTPVVTWKKKVLGVNSSDKQIVLDWCRRTYPSVSLRRSPRARTDSHDFADAVALATYAQGLLRERHSKSGGR